MQQMPIQTAAGKSGYKQNTKAYSLVELMVIVAILGILATFALVSYRDYVVRSSIASLVPIVGGAKSDVEAQHNEGVIFGTSGDEVLIATAATNKPFALDSMSRVAYGCIEVDIDLAALQLIPTNTLILTWCPTTDNGSIEWSCGYNSTSTAEYVTYLPLDCQVPNTTIQDTSF